MDDTDLFTKLLGIGVPWRVTRVSVKVAAERIDVGVEAGAGRKAGTHRLERGGCGRHRWP